MKASRQAFSEVCQVVVIEARMNIADAALLLMHYLAYYVGLASEYSLERLPQQR